MNRRSDFAIVFWSIAPMLVFIILVAVLICCAPSVDLVVWGK
jgi:hypothetical protein